MVAANGFGRVNEPGIIKEDCSVEKYY